MGFDEGAGDGQPQAGATAHPRAGQVGAVETVEDVGQVLGRDAGAGVGDGDEERRSREA
jgi:hypothetical protein